MQVPIKFDFPFWWLIKLLLKQQLDDVEENMVICEWGADQIFSEAERLRQIIDLWDTADKTIFCNNQVKVEYFLSFEHCLFPCIILIHYWQLRKEICHYSVKSMFTITQQNIICLAFPNICFHSRDNHSKFLKYANYLSDYIIHSTKFWSFDEKGVSANLYQNRLILCSMILLNIL